MHHKKKLLKISRIIIQIICFILLPSLYINALMGVKEIYLSILHNELSPDILPYLFELLVTVPITILFGRFFCGWMCAFGSLSDFVYIITDRFIPKKPRLKENVDTILKYTKYIILAFIIIVLWSFDVTLLKSSNPWDVFGMLLTVGKMPDVSFVLSNLLLGFIFFVLILFASAFIERFFCRYLCPMGAIFALTSFFRIGKIKKPTDQCGKCRICTNNCAMGIPMYKYDEIKSTECINCMKCVSVCPRKNTSYSVASKDVRPLVAGCVSVAVMTGTYYIGSISANKNTNSIAVESNSQAVSTIYNDGTYEGSGIGFRGQTTKVSVTIVNDIITDIQTISHGDDKPFYDRAYRSVASDIITSQSTQVDAVSGATYSSNGIMEAVAVALENALKQ